MRVSGHKISDCHECRNDNVSVFAFTDDALINQNNIIVLLVKYTAKEYLEVRTEAIRTIANLFIHGSDLHVQYLVKLMDLLQCVMYWEDPGILKSFWHWLLLRISSLLENSLA